MAARLGNVLYWTACIIAALFLALAGTQLFVAPHQNQQFVMIASVVIAAIVWLIGRAIRYILTDR
jgi:hypothetical protein